MPPKKNDAEKQRNAALEDSRAQVERETAEAEARQSAKPTPTQDENDRAKLGEDVSEKEADGSPEQSARAAMTYQTRDAAPAGKGAAGSDDNK